MSIKSIISAVICAGLVQLPAAISQAAAPLSVNESFDGYITNEIPQDLSINAKAYAISEYAPQDKGLLIYGGVGSSILTFSVPNLTDTCISFEIKSLDRAPGGRVSIENPAGVEQQLMQFNTGGGAGAHNGKPIGGFGKSIKTRYDIIYRPGEKNYDIYINGRKKIDAQRLPSTQVTAVAAVKFVFSSPTGEDAAILDNINIYSGTERRERFPREEYNPDKEDAPSFTFGENIGSGVLMNCDFEAGAALGLANNGNTLDIVEDDEGNHMLLAERVNTSDFHINAEGLMSESDLIVYDLRLKVIDLNSVMNIVQKDSAGQFNTLGTLSKGGALSYECGYSKQLSADKWYRLSFIINYFTREVEYYLDKKQVGKGTLDSGFAINGALPSIFRLHITHYASKIKAADTDPVKLNIDDLKIYEGKELIDDLGMIKKNIDLSNKRTVYASDMSQKRMLDGYSAVHVRDGVVFKDGNKALLIHRPYMSGDTAMVPAAELAEALGAEGADNGNSATVNGKVFSAGENGAEVKEGVLYVPLSDEARALSRIYTYVPAQYNSGLYVLGSASFSVPDTEEHAQLLNDYVFYLRPTVAQVKEAYAASPQHGVHPRVQATAADFERIRNEVKTDPYKKRWSEKLLAMANELIDKEPVNGELRDGVRLLMVSRDVLERMYTLGMAYQLTGDTQYSDRAYVEMAAVSAFADWHPQHHLDPCEMAAAVAIGYDWCYDAFTPEQRAVIEQGMYNNCFYDAWLSFLSQSSAMSNSAVATNNHNIVCNGGIAMGALAMLDVYPEVSEYLISNAVRGTDIMMWHWAPEGLWYEGPGYWEYSMQYTQKYISTLESVLGTDFGMRSCEGLDQASVSELYMQSPIGTYNYSDGLLISVYVPEMFWASDEYHDPDITRAVLTASGGTFSNGEDLALALIYYDTDIAEGNIRLDVDKLFYSENTMVMRSSWEDQEPAFVGIHAGKTRVEHSQLDGGSFIFENAGVRWAKDLGMGNYNSEGYWEDGPNGRRWMHFRSRAESHNTVIIDPDQNPDHKVESFAELNVLEDKPRGVIATVDMTELLNDKVTEAKRGFFFTDNRSSLVIRDEINLKTSSDIYWHMITDASAEIDGNTVILTQDGRRLKLEFTTNGNAAVSFARAEPLSSSPHMADDAAETANRLQIKVSGSGRINITVKLTQYGVDTASPLSEYDTDITGWHVPDGEIPTPPSIESVKVGDKIMSFNGKKTIDYVYIEGELASPPQVNVDSELYNIQVSDAATLNDAAEITVSDRNDPYNKTVYRIVFRMMKKPRDFDGRISLPAREFTVSEEPQAENPGINLFDNDLGTRWSAEGYGQWALLDIGSVQRVDDIAMAFYLGDTRGTKLTISVSEDNISYEEVWSGVSSGTTSDFEFFPTGGRNARYIRIGFNGNTAGAAESWNSVTEIVVTQKR